MDLNTLARQITTAHPWVTDAQVQPLRRVSIVVPIARITSLADYLKHRFQARPELVLAEDTRAASGKFTLRYLFELAGQDAIVIATTTVPADDPTFPSLGTRWYLASRFEREIHDLFGLTPTEHPDLRRLPLHQFWSEEYHPLLKDAAPPQRFVDDGTPYPFRRVEGEGVYEITVGPVHAGIIEPGHFRFSVEGETIINLESRLYFVHKGIEKQFENLGVERAVELAERISGDSGFAHALAFCQALESIANVTPPRRALFLRVVLLELERLYNHIADVGAILTDTGFAVANAHAMRLREEILRLNARLTGHRLLRGMLTPGGLRKDISAEQLADAVSTTTRVISDFDEIVEIALHNSLVLDRLHETGRLTMQTARELQVVGVPARASGIDADTRRDHPFAAYAELQPRVVVYKEGDVWARLMVRVEEAREAVQLIVRAAAQMPDGAISETMPFLTARACDFGLVEGWRGPIWHWVVIGEHNSFARVKVKDPSFANWTALNYAILNNIVPDFPLCNKSFNLSYAGNDL